MREHTVATIQGRLLAARRRLRLSQDEVASLVNVNQKTISNLENGVGHNTVLLTKVAVALGVDYEWLKTGRGIPPELLEPAQMIPKQPRANNSADLQKQIDELKQVIVANHVFMEKQSVYIANLLRHVVTKPPERPTLPEGWVT